jgi:hypothetical protein
VDQDPFNYEQLLGVSVVAICQQAFQVIELAAFFGRSATLLWIPILLLHVVPAMFRRNWCRAWMSVLNQKFS